MNNTSNDTHKERQANQKNQGFFSDFMARFDKFWHDFDSEYDEMNARIKERKRLNGRATDHEIDL